MSKSKKTMKKAAGEAPAAKPILRAIRVTPELLAAAKAYKEATKTSFYALGLEAISERLEREGYLRAAKTGV